jgi:hypothetical protein
VRRATSKTEVSAQQCAELFGLTLKELQTHKITITKKHDKNENGRSRESRARPNH